MIPKFIYLAPLPKIINKFTHETQIEKISDLPFCPVVPKITQKDFRQTKKTNQTNHKSR